MNIRDFLYELPDDFFSHLGSASLEDIVKGLPEPLFRRLVESVRHRLNASASPYPTDKEWAIWNSGKRIPAIKMLRHRTGAGLKEAKDMFERGKLDSIVNSIFFDEDFDEDEDREGECTSSV